MKITEMIKRQELWNQIPYAWTQDIKASNKYFSTAYEAFYKEKNSVGSFENQIFHEKDRVEYILSFCIQFKNLYNKRKGYYDELIEYWTK